MSATKNSAREASWRSGRTSPRLLPFAAAFVVISALLSAGAPAYAQGPITNINTDVAFDQHPGAQVPADLSFYDDAGKPVKLGDYFGHSPIILTLNYLSCQNECSFELNQLTGALADIPFNLGDEYAAITVSIDPRDTPDVAAEKKWEYVRNYARPGRGEAWHFLTGSELSIEQLARTVGFRYEYNAPTDEYAHPLGLIILTPEGRIARYLYGTDYDPRDVRLALVEASQNKIATPLDQLMLVCYHYDPANGRYSSFVLDLTRVGGVVTVLALGIFLGWMWIKDLRRDAQQLKREE
jgi:protein SCO1/2